MNEEENTTKVSFEDEKLVAIDISLPEEKKEEVPTKKKSKKKKNEKKEPYKNMKARKLILLLGFVISFLSFAIMVFSVGSLLIPNTYATIELFIPLNLASLALGFLGCVFSVAGANTKKWLARLSFLFCVLGFVISAGMVIVMLSTQLLPLKAIENLLS